MQTRYLMIQRMQKDALSLDGLVKKLTENDILISSNRVLDESKGRYDFIVKYGTSFVDVMAIITKCGYSIQDDSPIDKNQGEQQ